MNRIGRKFEKKALRMLRSHQGNAGPVIIHWQEISNADPEYDPELEGSIGAGSVTDHSDTIDAFIHYVSLNTTGFQRFQEVESGDVILDVHHSTDFTGKKDLRFEIDGTFYTQKAVSKSLARSWDASFGGSKILRSILLGIQQ